MQFAVFDRWRATAASSPAPAPGGSPPRNAHDPDKEIVTIERTCAARMRTFAAIPARGRAR
jgi:hypothetical protein